MRIIQFNQEESNVKDDNTKSNNDNQYEYVLLERKIN